MRLGSSDSDLDREESDLGVQTQRGVGGAVFELLGER